MRGETSGSKAPLRSLSAALLAALAMDAPIALQNMVAVQAAAQGARSLVQFGLALSIPLLALGSAGFIAVLRKPPLVWAGAGLLGWLAGQMAAADALVLASRIPLDYMGQFAPPMGAILAMALAYGFWRVRGDKGLNLQRGRE